MLHYNITPLNPDYFCRITPKPYYFTQLFVIPDKTTQVSPYYLTILVRLYPFFRPSLVVTMALAALQGGLQAQV